MMNEIGVTITLDEVMIHAWKLNGIKDIFTSRKWVDRDQILHTAGELKVNASLLTYTAEDGTVETYPVSEISIKAAFATADFIVKCGDTKIKFQPVAGSRADTTTIPPFLVTRQFVKEAAKFCKTHTRIF